MSGSAHIAQFARRVPFPVLECAHLNEETPLEYIAGGLGFRRRIRRFEAWLSRRRESSVIVCGHSAFFKAMLGQRRKMNNCDLVEVEFTVAEEEPRSARRRGGGGGGGGPKLVTAWGEPTLMYRVCHRRKGHRRGGHGAV